MSHDNAETDNAETVSAKAARVGIAMTITPEGDDRVRSMLITSRLTNVAQIDGGINGHDAFHASVPEVVMLAIDAASAIAEASGVEDVPGLDSSPEAWAACMHAYATLGGLIAALADEAGEEV